MNPTLIDCASPGMWPDCITINWRRLSHGLWRVPEGDIHPAYWAETFPRVAVFSHEGRLFTNCAVHFYGAVHAEADCYPLIPSDEYRGPEPLTPGELRPRGRPLSQHLHQCDASRRQFPHF